jgi:hypothetical protein
VFGFLKEIFMIRYLLFVFALIPSLIFAESDQGEKLLNRLWKDLRTRNVKSIKTYTSREFQSEHYDGARNRHQELQYITTLNIGSYVISDLKITRAGNVYVMTYNVLIEPEVAGGAKQFDMQATPRLTIFKKINGHWKWLAHANLTAPLT